MGLDIYLYRYDKSRAEIEQEDDAWEKISNAIFHKHFDPIEAARGKNAQLTDDERAAWKKEEDRAAGEFGRVGEWHDNPHNPSVRIDSTLYPEHMFKIGYFRSSYNGGGIDSILRDRVKESLHSIIGLDDEYVQQPDWNKAIENCDRVIAQLREAAAKNPFFVTEVGPNMFGDMNSLPKSEAEALAIAGKELSAEKQKDEFLADGYSNRDGLWYPKGMTVYGIIPGTKEIFGKLPTSYVVLRHDSNGEEPFKWYINALEIVKETAQWVLKQENPEKYFLHVSG